MNLLKAIVERIRSQDHVRIIVEESKTHVAVMNTSQYAILIRVYPARESVIIHPLKEVYFLGGRAKQIKIWGPA